MNVHSKKILIRDLKLDNILIYTGECDIFENMRIILSENKIKTQNSKILLYNSLA